MKLNKLEGYTKPFLMQLQWLLSIFGMLNVIYLVISEKGVPDWYWWFMPLGLIYMIYYFKRGRKKELENVNYDNLIVMEIHENVKKILIKLNEEK